MDLTNIPLTTPILPEINCDGYYPQCVRCWTELEVEQEICPKCNQTQDWSWFSKHKRK